MENNQQQAISQQKVLNTALLNMKILGVDVRLHTDEPTPVNGQLFQSTYFQVKNIDDEWINVKAWTEAIDPAKQIDIIDDGVSKLQEEVDNDKEKIAKKEAQLAEVKADAERVKASLEPFVSQKDEPTEVAEPK